MNRFHAWIAAMLVVAVLFCVAGPVLASEVKGTIVTLRPERNQVVVTESFKDMTFQLTPSTTILINGRASQLSDLRVGDQASVVFQRDDRRLMAVMVHVTRQ